MSKDKQDLELTSRDGRSFSIRTETPYYSGLLIPNGFLVSDPACHALFYYACLALKHVESEDSSIQYEGAPSKKFNARQLFSTIASMYGTTPEKMLHFWSHVDMTLKLTLKMETAVPPKYRFDKTPEIKTQ